MTASELSKKAKVSKRLVDYCLTQKILIEGTHYQKEGVRSNNYNDLAVQAIIDYKTNKPSKKREKKADYIIVAGVEYRNDIMFGYGRRD